MKNQGQLRTEDHGDNRVSVHLGFDAGVLAVPSVQAHALLPSSQIASPIMNSICKVAVAPCWTLMLAFPQGSQHNLPHLRPQWNAACSTRQRVQDSFVSELALALAIL